MVVEFNNCYHCPNVYVIAKICKTNKISNTALRGFGAPQNTLLSEALIDHVARELRKSPEKVILVPPVTKYRIKTILQNCLIFLEFPYMSHVRLCNLT